MHHVMSVKQTLREDLAEHAYQFSCRAADWSRSNFSSVPMRFEPLELHVVDALGQQEVPDYFQQPAKAITEDVSVMRGPHALEWICAVREETEPFKRLGVCEEVPIGKATSIPLPSRLILGGLWPFRAFGPLGPLALWGLWPFDPWPFGPLALGPLGPWALWPFGPLALCFLTWLI